MVYSLAMIDGGWQPSLKIMAAHIKQARAQKAASTGIIEKLPHHTHASGMKPASNYSRPDMESIRERLADRRGRQ